MSDAQALDGNSVGKQAQPVAGKPPGPAQPVTAGDKPAVKGKAGAEPSPASAVVPDVVRYARGHARVLLKMASRPGFRDVDAMAAAAAAHTIFNLATMLEAQVDSSK